jgi:hypothetical protein
MNVEYDLNRLINNLPGNPVLPPDISHLNANELQRVVLPPIGPYPTGTTQGITKAGDINGNTIEIASGDKVEQTIFGTPQIVPIQIKLKSESDYWLFPVEPMLTINGKNILIKRNVAKKKKGFGSIKEYWTQDDYTITIQGLLTTPETENYPVSDFNQLMKYCTAKEALDVKCEALQRIGVSKLVIETYDLPFTKGPENQNFSITAYSDTDAQLLIKKKVSVA